VRARGRLRHPVPRSSWDRGLDDLVARLRIDRRQFLRAVAAALAWTRMPGSPLAPVPAAAVALDPAVAGTLEAFADTLIPGAKRAPDDRAIAGAGTGAGAVQAGALDLLGSPRAGLAGLLPALTAQIDAAATAFADAHGIALEPAVPPLVALDFAARTTVLVDLLAAPGALHPLFLLLAVLAFLAYHTAAHLPTVEAIRDGHPGLAAIGFPAPDADGLWRFPRFSYRRRLARRHPRTRRGHPR